MTFGDVFRAIKLFENSGIEWKNIKLSEIMNYFKEKENEN